MGGCGGAAAAVRIADATRARGDDTGRGRPAEQTDCGAAAHQRGHGEGASGPAHAEDGSGLGRAAGADRGRAWSSPPSALAAFYQGLSGLTEGPSGRPKVGSLWSVEATLEVSRGR